MYSRSKVLQQSGRVRSEKIEQADHHILAADVLADRNIYHGSDSWRMDDMVIPSPYKEKAAPAATGTVK